MVLLRRFSRMTEEMRPAHRINVLSGGLEYYAIQRKQKLGMYMCTYAFILYIFTVLIFHRRQKPHILRARDL